MIEYKMRRKNLEMTRESAEELLKIGSYGVLSTVGEDGYPYGVPVNYAYDGEKIYFHCAKNAGHKQANLSFSSKISFTVVLSERVIPQKLATNYKSVIAFGTAEKTESKKLYALNLLAEKYSSDFPEECKKAIDTESRITDIYEISVEKISGKYNPIT